MTLDDYRAIARFLDALRKRVWEMQTAAWSCGRRGFVLLLGNGTTAIPTASFLIYSDRVESYASAAIEGLEEVMMRVNMDFDHPISVPTEAFASLMQELAEIASALDPADPAPTISREEGPIFTIVFNMMEEVGEASVHLLIDRRDCVIEAEDSEERILWALMGAIVKVRYLLTEQRPWYKQFWYWLFPLWGE